MFKNIFCLFMQFFIILGSFQNSNIDMLILKILTEKAMYGYELIQKINHISNSNFTLKAGTLYPILHTLEKAGYVISYGQMTQSGAVRKYYQITADGKVCLKQKIQKWQEYSSMINYVLEN